MKERKRTVSMDCKQIDQLLVDYLYQELDATQMASFEKHLRGCSQCAEDLRSFEDTRAVMRDLDAHDPPPAITALILEEAAKAAPSVPTLGERIHRFFRLMVMHPALAAAATLVAVLGVSFYVYREGLPPATEGPRNDLPLVSSEAATATIKAAASATPKTKDEQAFEPKQQGQGAARPTGSLADDRQQGMPLQTSGLARAAAPGSKRGFVDKERTKLAGRKKMMVPPVQAVPADLKDSKIASTKGAKGDEDLAAVAKSRPRTAPARRRSRRGVARRARRVGNAMDVGGGGSAVWGNKSRLARRPAPSRAPKPASALPVVAAKPSSSMAEGRYQKDSDAANAAVPRGGLGQRARFRRDTPKKKISPATRFLLAGDQAIRAGRCPSAFDSYSRAIALQSSLRAAVYRRLGRCRASLDRSKRFRRLATLMALEGRRAIASRKAAARRRAAKRAHKKAKAKPAAVDAYQAK